MKAFTKKEWIIIGAFVIIKLLAHFLTNTHYDLHRDTFLYYALSKNLDWGYASVPPFIAVITRFSSLLFGDSAFALNLFPAVAGALSIVIMALIIKNFGGKSWAIAIASFAFLLSPAYLRSNSLLQPVSFDQFFWLLSAYFMVRLLKTQQPKFWIFIMLVWGVGFLNKYLIACLAVSFIFGLLLTRHRKLIWTKQFLVGGVIAFLIVLPNIIWQYNHNWAVFHHLSELNRNQLVNVSMRGFFIDQLLMNLPGVMVWITGVLVFLFIKEEKDFRALAFTYLFVLFILLITHGKSYYTLGIYTLLLALGGYFIEKEFKFYTKLLLLFFILLLGLPIIPFSLPVLSLSAMAKYAAPMSEFTNRWEDGNKHLLPQDYADMTGWKQLSDIVIRTYDSLSVADREKCGIYAENYGQAGSILYYGRNHHLPKPVSFSDNFLLWAPDTIEKKNLIYVNDEIGDIRLLFKKYVKKGQVNDPYFRENGVMVYYCSEPTDVFKILYRDKVKNLKMVYERH